MVGFISYQPDFNFLLNGDFVYVKRILSNKFSSKLSRHLLIANARNSNTLFVQYYTLVVFILYRLDTDFLLNDLFFIFSLDFQANLRPIGLLFVFVHIRAIVLLDTLFNILGSKNYDHFLLQFVHISVHIC